MADDVTITSGANSTAPDGTVIATDDVDAVHYQKVKVALGADGAVDTLLDSGQQAMADSAPVAIASDQSAIDVDATGQGDVPITLDGETVPVTGTFWQGTQPVLAAALPLPTGAAIAASQQVAAGTPVIYNITMTNSDTEYSQALPANTKRFSLQCLTDFDVRFAFESSKVATPTAPYALVRAGMNFYEEQVNLAAVTVYVASPDAGKVAEIIAWV